MASMIDFLYPVGVGTRNATGVLSLAKTGANLSIGVSDMLSIETSFFIIDAVQP